MGRVTECENIKNQTAIIKQRLNDLVSEHNPKGYKISQLREELSDVRFGGFKFSDNTISRTLDVVTDNQSLNLCVALAICRRYDVPYDSIFAPQDDIDSSHMFYGDDVLVSPTGVLLNEKYMHIYTGYMSPRNTGSTRLTKIKLELERVHGSSKATLICQSAVKTGNEIRETLEKYTGVPKVLGDKQKVVYIDFKSQDNNFFHFYFEYSNYTKQQMYFRRGAVFTQGSLPEKPLLLDFVLFLGVNEEPSEDIIRGLLTLPSKRMYIPKQEMDDMAIRDSEISSFLQEYGDLIREKSMYTYREDAIISEAYGENPLFEDPEKVQATMKCLLKLRHNSSSRSYVAYEDHEKLPKYAKDLVW